MILDIFKHKSTTPQDKELEDLRIFEKIYEEIISSGLELEHVTQKVADLAAKHLGTVSIVLTLLTEDGKGIYAHTISSGPVANILIKAMGDGFRNSIPIDKDYTLTIKSIRDQKIVYSKNVSDFTSPPAPKAVSELAQRMYSMKAVLSVPIMLNNKGIGAMICAFQKPYEEITSHQFELLEKFARYMSFAIERARAYESKQRSIDILTKKNEDLSSLYNLTANVSRSLDPFKVAQSAVNSIPQDKMMIGAILSKYYAEKNFVAPLVASENQISYAARKLIGDFSQYGLSLEDTNNQTNIVVRVIKTETAMFTNNLSEYLQPALGANLLDPLAKLLNIKSVAVFPLVIRGRTIGALAFMIKEKYAEEIDANEKQLLQTYTNQVAIAFENANLFAQSQEIQAKLEKTLKELEAARKHERDMIDIMGHELRTPMSIVRNALIMMDTQFKANPPDLIEKIKKYVEIGVESARREVALIETLLSATKTDGKGFQLLLEKIDLEDIINNSLIAFKRESDRKGIELIYQKATNPVFVYADRTRIQEIVDNFINNAVKYTMRGSVEVKVWQEGAFGYVSVKDTGIGISEEDMKKLGQKFFRARQYIDDVETENLPPEKLEVVRPGGTGLGLYVTFNLIKIMDGKLDVQSRVKEGSTFTFGMPIYTNQPAKQIERKIEPQE